MRYFVKYSNSKVGMQQQQLLEFAGRPGPVVRIPNPGNAGGQFGHVWGRGARLGGPVIPGAPLGAEAFYAPFNNANRANYFGFDGNYSHKVLTGYKNINRYVLAIRYF